MTSIVTQSLVGARVEFPIAAHEYIPGIVESIDEVTGKLRVIDEFGVIWRGYEYQLQSINSED